MTPDDEAIWADPERFLALAVAALVDVAGTGYAAALAPARDGDPDAVAALITFARIVRRIREGAATGEVHGLLRRLRGQLVALRERASRRAA